MPTRTIAQPVDPQLEAAAAVSQRRAGRRAPLSEYEDATMADSARSGYRPYWHNDQTFDMYATTTGLAHQAVAVPEVLQHPSHKRAPLSSKLHYTVSGEVGVLEGPRGAAANTTDALATTARTHSEAAIVPSAELAAIEAEGEAAVEATRAFHAHTQRDLCTIDPTKLPFGSRIVESETAASYRLVPKQGVEAITFYRDHPDAALNMNARERAILREQQSEPEPRDLDTAPVVAAPPQSNAPVYRTGMQSTYQSQYTPKPDPMAAYEQPANAVAAIASAPLTHAPPSGDTGLWQTSNADYGAADKGATVTQASLHATRDLSAAHETPQFVGHMWQTRLNSTRGLGEGMRTLLTTYHADYDRTQATEVKPHHEWH